jgi:hypothetical protein
MRISMHLRYAESSMQTSSVISPRYDPGSRGQDVAFRVLLAGDFEIGVERVGVVVGINEVISGVVRRVDVDHLHPTEVGLVEQLQDFEIVALDEDIVGGVPVD